MDKYIVSMETLHKALETFEPRCCIHRVDDHLFLEKGFECMHNVELVKTSKPDHVQLVIDPDAPDDIRSKIERGLSRLMDLCRQISGHEVPADPLAESSGQSNRPLDQRV